MSSRDAVDVPALDVTSISLLFVELPDSTLAPSPKTNLVVPAKPFVRLMTTPLVPVLRTVLLRMMVVSPLPKLLTSIPGAWLPVMVVPAAVVIEMSPPVVLDWK